MFPYSENVEAQKKKKRPKPIKYYNHWNPYRRLLTGEYSRDFFIAKPFYETEWDKNGRIKVVIKYDENANPLDSWHLIWNRSGTRSEYSIQFHQDGMITRVDSLLFSHKLSEVKSGWKAKVKSTKDGRPARIDIFDEKGIRYYFYRFHYNQRADSILSMEIIRSSYFRSDSSLVGRHLLYMENGEWLREIHYKDAQDRLIQTVRFDTYLERDETVRIIFDATGREIESRILPISYPDVNAYRFEWKPDTIMIVGDVEIEEDTIKYISPVLGVGWYGFPLLYESSLNPSVPHPIFGVFFAPRGNMTIRDMDLSFGVELISYKIALNDTNTFIEGIGTLAAMQYNLDMKYDWLPENVEVAFRFGGGMLSAGYGLSLSASVGYHLLPSRLYMGIYGQSLAAFNELGENTISGWGSLGLALGANFGDINPDLLKPYQDDLDEGAVTVATAKKIATESSIIGQWSYPIYVDTLLQEDYDTTKASIGISIVTPFKMNIGPIQTNLVIEIQNYFFRSSAIDTITFQGTAYLIGAHLDLDKIVPWGGERLSKTITLATGSYRTGFGVSVGGDLNYHFALLPFIVSFYGRAYAVPKEEIFTGWTSAGIGLGLDLAKLFSSIGSD